MGLARDGAREQRLAGPRRPVQQDAVGDARPEFRVALRVFEEVDDLFQLLLGLVDPGDVLEGDAVLGVRLDPARGRATEAAEDAAASPPVCLRISQMKKPMISRVGRKARMIVPSTERPESGADALITTWCSVSSSVTAWLSMNEGTSVLKSLPTFTGSPPPSGGV